MTDFKGAYLLSVFSNNFVNESLLSGFSFAKLEDNSVKKLDFRVFVVVFISYGPIVYIV